MPNFGLLILTGYLVRDPAARVAGKGTVTKFCVAYNPPFDKEQEKTVFCDVEVWGRGGELAMEHLHKKTCVTVTGKPEMHKWETDGVKHSKLVMASATWTFGDSRGVSSTGRSGSPPVTHPQGNPATVPRAQPMAEQDDLPF